MQDTSEGGHQDSRKMVLLEETKISFFSHQTKYTLDKHNIYFGKHGDGSIMLLGIFSRVRP